jgi:hypothetical protein
VAETSPPEAARSRAWGVLKGMVHTVDLGAAAAALNPVSHGARRAHVVQDPRLLAQDRLGQHGGEEVAGDELTGVVDEEASIGVAVPGDAEVGAGLAHLLDDELAVFRLQRVRLVVWELSVRLQ